ncbi:DUF2262 domain-containing protein [Treponema sp. OMZ 789]|nr:MULTISPECIES: DUF2262 domain-containing protein [unclassified Treponema]UTC68544.1 DUF2262 domain-containing protein [Treponema sp. OMZ 789]UTC69745.1 DUF2262 domain-containing protein [Treponema sp. OMZ 790]UTC72459.1 DUF2262 domain-containing protein [Treponema sp. OMZ 791]
MIENISTKEQFESKFLEEEKEILVLIETKTGGAFKFGDMWVPSNRPLAFIDLADNSLYSESIRLEWLVKDRDWKYYFKPQTAFRVKVRPQKPNSSSKHKHLFMLVEVLEEDVKDKRFDKILKEYNTEVIYEDEDFYFVLNKEYNWFEGAIKYKDEDIDLNVETEDLEELKNILSAYKAATKNFDEWLNRIKKFAAEQLTGLANDWQEKETPEITKKDFFDRVELSSIVLEPENNFIVYLHDDDMFFGHIICVYGNLDGKLDSANIEG